MHTAPVSIDNITNTVFLRLDTLTILILYEINDGDNLMLMMFLVMVVYVTIIMMSR